MKLKNKIEIIEVFTYEQIKLHKLKDWKFIVFNAVAMDHIQKVRHNVEKTLGEVEEKPFRLLAFAYGGKEPVIGIRRSVIQQNSIETVKKIIKHEVAHAMAGVFRGHDKKFRRIAKSMGAYINSCTPRNVKG